MSEKLVSRSGIYKFTLYVPEEQEDSFKEFMATCHKNGKSASSEIIALILQKVPAREPENSPCELCGQLGLLYDVRFISGKRMLVCSDCFHDRERKDLVRSVIREPFNPNLYGVQGKP